MDKRQGRISRRTLLGHGSRGAAIALGSKLTLFSAPILGSVAHNRALVCVFLNGGHDSANAFVPLESSKYREYISARRSLGLHRDNLLPVGTGSGEHYGFHRSLRGVAQLFANGEAAVVANAGASERPKGFGGSDLQYLADGFLLPAWAAEAGKANAAKGHRFNSGLLLLAPDYADNHSGIDGSGLTPIADAAAADGFGDDPLSVQLRQAAALIQHAPRLGLGRQIYVATLSGFHYPSAHARLLRQFDRAAMAFRNAAVAGGFENRTVLFTDCEFGRTLIPTAGRASLGWGAHQIVMGAAIRGGRVHGNLPTAADVAADGAWIPSIRREQMVAPLTRWAGFNSSDFPNHSLDLIA